MNARVICDGFAALLHGWAVSAYEPGNATVMLSTRPPRAPADAEDFHVEVILRDATPERIAEAAQSARDHFGAQ